MNTYTLSDSLTMLRRNLRHALRYPSMTVSVIVSPVIMLLLFVYVFGGAMSASLTNTGIEYIDYLVPGILLMTMGSGSMPTAVGVCTDMTEGIMARFRTMAIARSSVATGHVVGSVIQTLISVVLVFGVSLLMGFRPDTDVAGWFAVAGVVVLVTFAITSLSVALGLVSRNPEGASNIVLPFSLLLPFVSSAFVPLESMPSGVRWFAEYQPFTPIIETLRGLLMGTPIGNNGTLTVIWCVLITVGGYFWSRALFNREPAG
jgi:ABC-2 type transport system permease protein